MDRQLRLVARAARDRAGADQAYRAAIQAARDSGHTLQAIGDAAGITKNGVRYLLYPDPRKEQT